jgi:hypothetical protein
VRGGVGGVIAWQMSSVICRWVVGSSCHVSGERGWGGRRTSELVVVTSCLYASLYTPT